MLRFPFPRQRFSQYSWADHLSLICAVARPAPPEARASASVYPRADVSMGQRWAEISLAVGAAANAGLADIGHRLRQRRTVGAFRRSLSRKGRTRCDREWAPRVTAETQAALPLPMTKPSPLWAGATCSFRQLHRPFGGKVSRLPARSETQDLSCGRARARRVWGAAQRPPEVFTRRSGTVPN
jgi:hypothetical protein